MGFLLATIIGVSFLNSARSTYPGIAFLFQPLPRDTEIRIFNLSTLCITAVNE
jgi:hypothetical protein